MKKSLFILFFTTFTLSCTHSLYAQTFSQNQEKINQGVIHFSGSIVEPSCEFNPNHYKIDCSKNNQTMSSQHIFQTERTQINHNNELITISYY